MPSDGELVWVISGTKNSRPETYHTSICHHVKKHWLKVKRKSLSVYPYEMEECTACAGTKPEPTGGSFDHYLSALAAEETAEEEIEGWVQG